MSYLDELGDVLRGELAVEDGDPSKAAKDVVEVAIQDLLTWFDGSQGYSDIDAEQRIRDWAVEHEMTDIDPEAR